MGATVGPSLVHLLAQDVYQEVSGPHTGEVSAEMLKACGVDRFQSVDVLADPEIRQGIKGYSNWPTIPQLYVNGEFVGGADIMREMYQSGELQKMLETAKA